MALLVVGRQQGGVRFPRPTAHKLRYVLFPVYLRPLFSVDQPLMFHTPLCFEATKNCETDLDVPISVEEDVPELEIAVDDLVPVQVARCLEDLQHVPSGLVLREALCFAYQFRQGLS